MPDKPRTAPSAPMVRMDGDHVKFCQAKEQSPEYLLHLLAVLANALGKLPEAAVDARGRRSHHKHAVGIG